MPYIEQHRRPRIDACVQALAQSIESDGELNYAITRLLLAQKPCSYAKFNALVGVLECCKLEFYRRAVAPYENIKRDQNGDAFK